METTTIQKAQNATLGFLQANFEDLIYRFIDYLDVKPKSAQTYMINLKQFAQYLKDHGITQPQRADVIEYREELKATHKSTTVQGYITAVKLFFNGPQQREFIQTLHNISKERKSQECTRKML